MTRKPSRTYGTIARRRESEEGGLFSHERSSEGLGRENEAESPLVEKGGVNFLVTVLKILAAFAVMEDPKRDMAILSTSGGL